MDQAMIDIVSVFGTGYGLGLAFVAVILLTGKRGGE
jgi:hypothetical protein